MHFVLLHSIEREREIEKVHFIDEKVPGHGLRSKYVKKSRVAAMHRLLRDFFTYLPLQALSGARMT